MQEETTGCGIAAVATLARVTYKQARSLALEMRTFRTSCEPNWNEVSFLQEAFATLVEEAPLASQWILKP